MESFQAKKPDSLQRIDDHLISFGNLDDLKRTASNTQGFNFGRNQLLHRQFHSGNYVLTKLTDDDSNLSIIIHHENADPKAIMEKLHDESMEMSTKAAETTKSSPIEIVADDQKCLIDSNDWFTKEKRNDAGGEKKSEIDDDGDGNNDDGQSEKCGLDHGILDYDLMQKIYEARILQGDNPDEAKSKSLKYSDLLFVVNSLYWMEKTDWTLTSIDEGKTYQLEFQGGDKIGFAFDVKQYFGEEKVRGVLLQHRSTVAVPFALILESEMANMLRPKSFVYPMDDFLYESEYRQFFDNGQKHENPYYGPQIDGSPFVNLPSNLFVKIVSYLTLKERVSCRRVNQRWRKISNKVLAVGTKQIDQIRDGMVKNWTNADLNHMIPLVAGGLESLKLDSALTNRADFEFVMRPDVFFRSLRQIDIGCIGTLDYDLVARFMDKAPGLKKFAGNIRLVMDEAVDQREFKSVEELILGRHEDNDNNINDLYLMTLIDLFPNIRKLSLHSLRYISASAASVMAERLGPKLEYLEMRFVDLDPDDESEEEDVVGEEWIPPLGVFDGIGSCVNLTTLILTKSNYVSNGFINALATGCPLLETLDLAGSSLPNGSSAVLEKLNALTNLTKLDVSYIDGVSDGLMHVVREGRLEQLLMRSHNPSVELMKACVRYCSRLLLLDVCNAECTSADAIEILTLYGRYGRTRRTVIRTCNPVWLSAQVADLQMAIKNGDHAHRGSFVIDRRCATDGFVDNATEEYERADPNELVLESDDDENEEDEDEEEEDYDDDDDGDEDYDEEFDDD